MYANYLCLLLTASLPFGKAWRTPPALRIDAPYRVPVGASEIVDHTYASFSFPAHFFADFAGNKSHPNLFSRDIVELLGKKTGIVPYIRVGGTSADHTYYNESQAVSVIQSEFTSNGIPRHVDVGPVWFEGFHNFPGTKWIFQVNFWNTTENALNEARQVVDAAGKDLLAIEIGNEPDIAVLLGEATEFTLEQYVEKWTTLAGAISSHVLSGNPYGLDDRYLFEALTYGTLNYGNFSVEGAFEHGINRDGHVKLVSQHQYMTGSSWWVTLQRSFLNHTAIAANLSQFQDDIRYIKENHPNVTYVLGETNNDYVNLNMGQISGVFGNALWTVDYLLYGLTQNITRMHFIQGTNFGYTAWVPVATEGHDEPYTRPPLYGFLFHADVIGRGSEIRVKEVALDRWDFSAYAIYDAGRLAKYALVNLDEWNSTTPYKRPYQRVSIAAPGGRRAHGRHAHLQRLAASGASADENITWGGLSWNYTDGRLAQHGHPEVETLVFDRHGRAETIISSSEAVLITFL